MTYKVTPTQKLFFNEYKYRARCTVYCGRVITDYKLTVAEALDVRRKWAELDDQSSSSGSFAFTWQSIIVKNAAEKLSRSNKALLEAIKEFAETHKKDVKLRIEEPTLSFYSNSLELIRAAIRLIESHSTGVDDYNKVIEISKPAAGTVDKLNQGYAFIKKDNGYKAKAWVRSGSYDAKVKNALYCYLMDTEQFSIPPGLDKRLSKDGDTYIWNSYFYYNDDDSLAFLRLIDPGFIIRTVKLEVLK